MKTISEQYIENCDKDIQPKLCEVYHILKNELPNAQEKMSYGMPTFWQGRNLIHFAAQKKHIGIYPGSEAIEVYKQEIEKLGFTYSKRCNPNSIRCNNFQMNY